MTKKTPGHVVLAPDELGLSMDEAFSAYLKRSRKSFAVPVRFIAGLKVSGIAYSVLLSYLVSSTVELATLTGFSKMLVHNLVACLMVVATQYVLGSIRGDESLRLGSRMDQGFVENISQLSLYSNVSLTPRFVSFVKELRVARTEYIPELVTILLGIIAFLGFAHLKGALLTFIPMILVFVIFLIWTFYRRKENARTWDLQEEIIRRGLRALEESEVESLDPIYDEGKTFGDIKEYFRLKLRSFKEDFATKGLIILAAINAAIIFSSTNHPDRIVLSTLGLFAAKLLQDAVPVWLELLRTKEVAKSLNWDPITKQQNEVLKSNFNGEFRFENVSFRYSPQAPWILYEINFKVDAGETLTISGPSGSGKSSFLRLVTGELKPSEGAVVYTGLKNEDAPSGFYQVAGHMSHESSFPNVKVGTLFSWFDSYKSRKEMVLDCVELHPRTLELSYSSLSQGEKKKVAIAVAIFQCKSILILDEPYSGLDQNSGLRLAAKLAELPYTKVISVTDDKALGFSVQKGLYY